jgi:hypothetical protein
VKTFRSLYGPEWIFRVLPVQCFRLLAAHGKRITLSVWIQQSSDYHNYSHTHYAYPSFINCLQCCFLNSFITKVRRCACNTPVKAINSHNRKNRSDTRDLYPYTSLLCTGNVTHLYIYCDVHVNVDPTISTKLLINSISRHIELWYLELS